VLLKVAKISALAILLSTAVASQNAIAQDTSAPHASAAVPIQVIVLRSSEDADKILVRLKAGEDFASLAKTESIDPTAPNGGFIGDVDPGSLRSELRDALAGKKPGELSDVTHIPSGYAILRIAPGAPNSAAAPTSSDASVKKTSASGPSYSIGASSSMGSPPVDSARSFDLAAAGAIRYSPDIDGLGEAQAVLSRFPKPAGWNTDPHTVCDLRLKSLESSIAKLSAYLAPENQAALASKPPLDLMQTHMGLAQLYAFKGDMVLAIGQYEESYKIALASVPKAIPQMQEALGIAHLHKAEMDNEVYRKPGEKCLFPMPASVAYKKTEDSEKAIEYFTKYLEERPNELEVKWLLNVAYMTLGKYPAAVPSQYLLPPSAFESNEDIGRFHDVAAQIGIDNFSEAGGVVVDDFENNGRFDVITSSFESCASLRYFHNNGDGTFTEQTEKSGLKNQFGGLNIIQTDYDNDGCLDILLLRGAWEFPQRSSLLKGHCDGTFTDVTDESGIGDLQTTSQTGVWADINNDGLLDLFIVNESGPAQLYLNKGNGKFEEIALLAGVEGDGTSYSKAVVAADYDNDGYVDFYVSNLNGSNYLYHNNHNNTFTETAYKAGVLGVGKGFGAWFFDFDNDGLPDIFVTSYFVSVDETVRTYLNLPHNAGTLKLYKNLGNGKFQDVTAAVKLDKVFMPMGANFGDVDNDGYLDIYLGTGNPSYASIVPNVLLRNHDGKYFTDITTSSGTGDLHKGHAVAFADLTSTGNEDIITSIGGATFGDRHALRIFANPGHDNDWIALKLVGTKTNRAAIGAKIKVTVQNDNGEVRSIYRTVGSGASFGASPLEQHIGLGHAATIKSVEVFWPVSGTHQTFTSVAKNQFLEIKELTNEYVHLDRQPVHFGTAPAAITASTSTSPDASRPAQAAQ